MEASPSSGGDAAVVHDDDQCDLREGDSRGVLRECRGVLGDRDGRGELRVVQGDG